MNLQRIEVNGGKVEEGPPWQMEVSGSNLGYINAQIDDYHGRKRKNFPWNPGVRLSLNARFSGNVSEMRGTAGFGFWNAPFGDPRVPWPSLPRAVWFFFASQPNNLPLAPNGPGQGWFTATISVDLLRTAAVLPAAPALLFLNQFNPMLSRIWPWLSRYFRISFCPIEKSMDQWHQYELNWHPDGCNFHIDNEEHFSTKLSPSGPLGFVCWIDNQYLIATPRGRFRWGTLKLHQSQSLEVEELSITDLVPQNG